MDIFIVRLDIEIEETELSGFQKKTFGNIEKQREHSVSYYFLDRILRDFYNIKDRDIEFVNKKPFLKSREKFFSLSHSGKYAAFVISDNDCGIDIEKIRPLEYEKIVKRMKLPECKDLENFFEVWTEFESLYKLGKEAGTKVNFIHENYAVCACSEKVQEPYKTYILNRNDFSKPKN